MNNIITLLKLEFRNKYGSMAGESKKSWIKPITSLIFAGILMYLVYFGATVFFEMFAKAGLLYEALVLVFTVLFWFLLISGTSGTIKVLYYKGDNIILMRFPVSGEAVFISKTLFLLVSQIVTTTIIIAPFMIAYASITAVSSAFYYMVPVVVVFMVAIPFFLSNVLAIPIMHITNKIRNKFALIIAGLSITMAGLFAGYMLVFRYIVDYLRNSNFSVFSDEVVAIIKDLASNMLPTRYFADIMVGFKLYIAFPMLILIAGISLIGTILVIAKLYQKTLLNNVEVEGSAFKKKTSNRMKPVFITCLKKEFVNVFRSVNYSFQYFVLACSMPVMVYFCNDLALRLGRNDIGEEITVGMTILVMLIFSTVIVSFAATSVSREGKCFYLTKIIPVSIHKQLLVKFTMYLLVSLASNIICLAVLLYTELMQLSSCLFIFGIVQSVSIGLTLVAMKMDVKKPTFNMTGEGEVVNNNANTTSVIGLGFVMAILLGATAMITAFLFVVLDVMYMSCGVIAGVFSLVSIIVFFINLRKTYYSIA